MKKGNLDRKIKDKEGIERVRNNQFNPRKGNHKPEITLQTIHINLQKNKRPQIIIARTGTGSPGFERGLNQRLVKPQTPNSQMRYIECWK